MSGPAIVRDVLARHREDPSVALPFEFAIYWQLDQEVGATLAKDLEDHGAKWEIRRAIPSLWTSIPACSGLYMFVYKTPLKFHCAHDDQIHPRWVLYVGRAGSAEKKGSLKQRYKDEYQQYVGGHPEALWNADRPTNRVERLRKYLTIYPLEYWFCCVDNHAAIPLLEERLIRLLSPPLNDKSRLKLKPLKSEQASAFKVY